MGAGIVEMGAGEAGVAELSGGYMSVLILQLSILNFKFLNTELSMLWKVFVLVTLPDSNPMCLAFRAVQGSM